MPADSRRPARALSPFVRLSLAVNVAGALALAAIPSRWPLVVAPLLLDHLVLVNAGLWPRSRLLGPNLTRLPSRAADEVALTFDDGPHPEVTPLVLDLLERAGARATFFCVGKRVERWRELAAEIARRGHRIENHSYHHCSLFWFLGPRSLVREVGRAQEVIATASGRRPTYFRPPAGIRSPWLDPLLARSGLHLVSWTRRGFDTVDRDPARVAARLLRALAPGDIILLHDGASTRDRNGRPVVLEALQRLLDALDVAGLRSVTLPRTDELPADR